MCLSIDMSVYLNTKHWMKLLKLLQVHYDMI